MNKNLKQLLKMNNLTMEDLGLDPNTERFTFEEIYNLSMETGLPLKNVFSSVLRNDVYYSVKAFERGVLNGEIEKVIKTIVSGYVLNVNDKLYFANTNYRLSGKNLIDDEVAYKLLELLLMNNECVLARRLSSKNLFYKFDNIYDERFPEGALLSYLLGEYDFESNRTVDLDYYSDYLYNNLEPKSKEEVKSLLMENYKCLVSAYLYGKAEGEKFEIGKNYFAYFIKEDEENQTYYMHFIPDIYKNFSDDEQKEVITILEAIK